MNTVSKQDYELDQAFDANWFYFNGSFGYFILEIYFGWYWSLLPSLSYGSAYPKIFTMFI